jgi:hypothetical protein
MASVEAVYPRDLAKAQGWCKTCQRLASPPGLRDGHPVIDHPPCSDCGEKWYGVLSPSAVGPWADGGFGK